MQYIHWGGELCTLYPKVLLNSLPPHLPHQHTFYTQIHAHACLTQTQVIQNKKVLLGIKISFVQNFRT